MRRVLTLCALATVWSALALAEDWTGRLIDANCYMQQTSVGACDASSSTSAFALSVSGKVFKLDDAGNAKAAEAVKSRADRSADPAKPPSTAITAKVTGTKGEDDTLKVEAIEVQ